MRDNPFPGAASKVYEKKKKNKIIERNGVKCSCGVVLEFWTELHFFHDDDCIINKKSKKRKR